MYTEKMAKLSCLRHMTLKPIIRRQLYTGFSGVFEKIKGFLVAPRIESKFLPYFFSAWLERNSISFSLEFLFFTAFHQKQDGL